MTGPGGPEEGAPTGATRDAAAAAAEAAWRHESARVTAALVRITRDLDLAEDLAQDALLAALNQWPELGIPHNPGAWLMSVAKRRAVDHFRRADTRRRLVGQLGHAGTSAVTDDLAEQVDRIEDDVLRLMFLACHPALGLESRAALTLRLVCGLTTSEIARAFLVKETAVAARITRAKKALADEPDAFDPPGPSERARRLADVMRVVYLIFNEGYSATVGDDWMRHDLCLEALRLARLLAALVPQASEVHGLQALLEIQASRASARMHPDGTPVLLEDQDRTRWDGLLVRRGFAAMDRAEALRQPAGPYVLQAAIAATHARARRAEDTDWTRIAELYDILATVTPSPIIEVNRAVAHGRAYGAQAGLRILQPLAHHPALAASHLLPAARGDLRARAGDHTGAAADFEAAALLTRNSRERDVLRERAATASRNARPGG